MAKRKVLTVDDVRVMVATLKKDAVMDPKAAPCTQVRIYEDVLAEIVNLTDQVCGSEVQALAKEALKAKRVKLH